MAAVASRKGLSQGYARPQRPVLPAAICCRRSWRTLVATQPAKHFPSRGFSAPTRSPSRGGTVIGWAARASSADLRRSHRMKSHSLRPQPGKLAYRRAESRLAARSGEMNGWSPPNFSRTYSAACAWPTWAGEVSGWVCERQLPKLCSAVACSPPTPPHTNRRMSLGSGVM